MNNARGNYLSIVVKRCSQLVLPVLLGCGMTQIFHWLSKKYFGYFCNFDPLLLIEVTLNLQQHTITISQNPLFSNKNREVTLMYNILSII